MKHIYLAQWEWNTDDSSFEHWEAPGGNALGLLDLRTLPEMGQSGGTPQGYGVFVYDTPQTISGAVYLGDSLDALQNKTELEKVYGTLQANTVKDFLWDMLTKYSDPTGQTAPKPLIATSKGVVELHLGGFSLIKSEPRNLQHMQREIEVFQADYRRHKDNNESSESLQRFVGGKMQKMYGKMDDQLAKEILPTEYKNNDGWKKPETSLADTFNRADNTDLNNSDTGKTKNGSAGTWQWVEDSGDIEILSNQIEKVSTNAKAYARANDDLSSDDHYSQIDIITNTSADDRQVVFCRKVNSSTITMYRAALRGTNNQVQMHRVVGGTETQLGSNTAVTVSVPDTMKIEADGSTIILYWNGTATITQTDTNITGNLQAGFGYGGNDSEGAELDNWEAADLGGGEEPKARSLNLLGVGN